jgi:mono/diheme cytochrome c family protein
VKDHLTGKSRLGVPPAGIGVFSRGALAAQDVAVPPQIMEEGAALYLVNCRQCHGTRGTAGVPLASSERIGDADHVVTTIITGPGYMAAFGDHLDDAQIAAITTYVRNSWGNEFGLVEPEDVAALR